MLRTRGVAQECDAWRVEVRSPAPRVAETMRGLRTTRTVATALLLTAAAILSVADASSAGLSKY